MKSVALPCLLVVTLGSGHAWSQGATGGSLGNDNKSLSGSSSEPRAAAPARRERSEPRAAPVRRSSDDGGGSVARFDGRWRMSFTGRSKICAGITADSTFTVSGGRTNDGSTVTSSGAFQGVANTSGVSAVLTGRLSGRSGGGSMQMSNGCSGRWTAVKL
ncbi:hypothetical protein [Tardiphaga sp.]|jgi:hypothetical protein|uniref:hypothetical protein n=1 Tax=Tardiphaga sp. TaxID=1926292 RepID=UPI0037DA6C15